MITHQEYYTNRLYLLQDGIMEIVKNLNTPFYLTGAGRVCNPVRNKTKTQRPNKT